MEFVIFDSYNQMCEKIALEIEEQLKKKPTSLLCIAAGHTSTGLFEHLLRLDFKDAKFVAMDEWLGMSEKTPGSCGTFLRENFLSKANFAPSNVRLFDGKLDDYERECQEVSEFISDGIDYLVLGTGMNGHLGLNEPGCDLKAGTRRVELDSVTQKVAQKYFEEQTPLLGGLTMGIGDFAKARRTVLMVSGYHKYDILHKIIDSPITPEIPATAIKDFENASLYCDKEAWEGM